MSSNYTYQNLPPFVEGELSTATWNEDRRKEILELFRSEVYGRIPGTPAEACRTFGSLGRGSPLDESSISISHRVADFSPGFMGGRATRKLVEIIAKRKDREFIIPFFVFIPNGAEKKPVPAILTVVNRELSDADPSRKSLSPFWPAEMMISRGYAAAVIITHEIAPDYEENFTSRFHRLFPDYVSGRPADAWGAISAWAWGMSRAIDYLVTDPCINGKEIAVAGHSRGGKTSLWCGAQDSRVSLVISSCSGCSGAAITRGKTGEHIKEITNRFPFWFCANYRKYADNEDAMPFDQHLLLALVAPRPLYLSEKTFDTWCDPKAEFESLRQVSKIYKLYNQNTDLGDNLPGPEEGVVSGNLGFHIKTGVHNMDEYDWERYLNFCDKHFHPAVKR